MITATTAATVFVYVSVFVFISLLATVFDAIGVAFAPCTCEQSEHIKHSKVAPHATCTAWCTAIRCISTTAPAFVVSAAATATGAIAIVAAAGTGKLHVLNARTNNRPARPVRPIDVEGENLNGHIPSRRSYVLESIMYVKQ